MADAPVEFDQAKLFQQNDPILNAVLTNIATFAGDVSGGLGTLIQFLNITKVFLRSVADPIALILIPAIDQLIEAIEDLKNIGFGTLTVWPWESGQVESGIDTTQALQAIEAMIASLNEINPEKLRWNPSKNEFETINVIGDRDQLFQQTGISFNFSAYENITIEDNEVISTKSLDDEWVNNTLNTIYNYLNPKEWEEGDDAAKRVINSLNESFKIRTLTPAQFVSEVNSSFSDSNDPARPVGSGDYVAFVGFFALPTHHALRDMINALLKFFTNFLRNIPDLQDDKITEIELGHPLVISGIEKEIDIAMGEATVQVDNELLNLSNEISENIVDSGIADDATQEASRLKGIIDDAKIKFQEYGSEIANYSSRILELQQDLLSTPDAISVEQEIARLSGLKTTAQKNYREQFIIQQEFGRKYTQEIAKSQNLKEAYNKSLEKGSQLEAKRNALEKRKDNISLDNTPLKKKYYSLDETSERDLSAITEQKIFTPRNNRHTGITIPFFEPEQIIQQGHVFNDFTAEVVSHSQIIVQDGQVISNKVKVRKVRGAIRPSTTSPQQTINVPPIIALDGKKLDTFGVLKTGQGLSGARESLEFPMFAPANPDVPQTQPAIKFKASIVSGTDTLFTVLPVNDEVIQYGETIDIYKDEKSLNKPSFQMTMENFVENLTVGSPILHNFLTTAPVSEFDIPVNPFDRLSWSVFPGVGVTPVIKKVKIGGKDIEKQDIKTQLFIPYEKNKSSKTIVYREMKEITIEIGRLTKTGDIEPYPKENIKVPDDGSQVTGVQTNATLATPFTLMKIDGARSSIPNWKFTRIQDLFPIYGEVIDAIVNKLEFAKDLAGGALEDINKWIEYFEKLVRDLKQLNQDIQNLLQFLASGLDKAGLYSASFSGNDGVAGFKKRLSGAKIKNVNLEPVKEFSLEPVSVTNRRQNPITGAQETITSEVLKLIAKENPESVGDQLLSWSDLDSLKYSGGFVFYAQGNDTKLLEKFLLTSGLKKTEEKENPQPLTSTDGAGDGGIDFAEVNSLLENVQPLVDKIQVQQIGEENDNVFIDANSAENVRKNTQIKILFKNQSSILTPEEKQKIKDAKNNDFIFDVDIQYGSVFTARTDDVSLGNVILSKDNFQTATPLSFAIQPVRETITINDNEIQVVNAIIVKPQENLESLTNYKLKILTTVLNTGNQLLKEEFELGTGFKTAATQISDIGLL